jgi:methionine synthase II (cobalamin-independent)
VTNIRWDGDLPPIRTTGIGSWPGTDMMDAIKIAFAECPDLPYVPELPARGPHAQMIGRSTAFLAGLTVDLQPAGWRLTDASSRDHRLAISTLRADLDLLEEHAQGYQGTIKLSVAGPWTLAAMMERPRGDRLLADYGARRDLNQSLAEGIAQLVAELSRRLPDVEFLIQLDEPLLPAVLAGTIATASGFSRHRSVEPNEVSAALILTLVRLAPTSVAVHCCAAGAPIDLLRTAGVAGVLIDIDQLSTAGWDAVAATLEAGQWVGMGALPTDRTPHPDQLGPDQVARRVLQPVRDLGLEPPTAARMVITPACGLASGTRDAAVQALRTLRSAAQIVTEQLAD